MQESKSSESNLCLYEDFTKALGYMKNSLVTTNSQFINTINSTDLAYENFFFEHMVKNIPCIIKNITMEGNCSKWIIDNKPDFEYLTAKYGSSLVPVADCGDKYYNSQKKGEQTLNKYLEYWKTYIFKNYPPELPCYYLKDWHFTQDFPDEDVYRVPSFFASDWLNEYFTGKEDIHDDYRFVYMGPKGSWTPFHADVFSSFSWSINLCGEKRWVLFPPGQEKCLTDKHGNLVYDIKSPSLKISSQFENYHELKGQIEIIQKAGDAIFVPSGWHHQVWNLKDTISINHNWINGCNIDKMWTSLQLNLAAVKKEISDCQDMEGWEHHCQVMLNATYGLDYKQFCQFLLYIVGVRLEHFKVDENLKMYGGWIIGHNHLKFDMLQGIKILEELISNADFIKLNYHTEESEIRDLIKEIHSIMDRK